MKLSIVIPAIGLQSEIDSTLVSVLENRPQDCEILLVHPDSYVDPYGLDDEIRLVESRGETRLELFNDGFRNAQHALVHTLSPGIVVEDGWCEPAVECFRANTSLGTVSPSLFVGKSKKPIMGVRFRATTGRRLVRRKAERVLGPSVESGFYLKSALQFMQGFHCPYGELADIDLGLRLRSADYQTVKARGIRLQTSRLGVDDSLIGYRGGQIRGHVCQLARQLGLASSTQSLLGTLTEPLRNGIGMGVLTGLVGRCMANLFKPQPRIHTLDDLRDKNRRSAA